MVHCSDINTFEQKCSFILFSLEKLNIILRESAKGRPRIISLLNGKYVRMSAVLQNLDYQL